MLEQFIVSQVFVFFLIFCRVGSAVMIMPMFSGAYVPASLRLSFALILSLLLTPFLAKIFPAVPASAISFGLLVVSEIFVGLFIGLISVILISALHTAGMVFSFQSGMSSAVVYDVTNSSQGSLVGTFMALLALVLIFTTGLHHFMLRAITDSYIVFVPGKWPPLHDFVETITRLTTDTLLIATQLAAPFIVVGTLLFLGSGILARLMPTIQVFYLLIPPQLIINTSVLILTFSGIMLWYMEFYREKLIMVFGYVK